MEGNLPQRAGVAVYMPPALQRVETEDVTERCIDGGATHMYHDWRCKQDGTVRAARCRRWERLDNPTVVAFRLQ